MSAEASLCSLSNYSRLQRLAHAPIFVIETCVLMMRWLIKMLRQSAVLSEIEEKKTCSIDANRISPVRNTCFARHYVRMRFGVWLSFQVFAMRQLKSCHVVVHTVSCLPLATLRVSLHWFRWNNGSGLACDQESALSTTGEMNSELDHECPQKLFVLFLENRMPINLITPPYISPTSRLTGRRN